MVQDPKSQALIDATRAGIKTVQDVGFAATAASQLGAVICAPLVCTVMIGVVLFGLTTAVKKKDSS